MEVKKKSAWKFIVAAGVLVALLVIGLSMVVVVPAGSTGVIVTFGKVSETVLPEGLHFKAPFIQQAEIIVNKIQKEQVEAAAVSKDLQAISSVIAVNYRVGLGESANIYRNIGRDYQSVILLPAVQESMKSVSAKYTAEELITKRVMVGAEIKETLENKVKEYGIVIENFNIVNFDFSPEFNLAIEAKQVAEQNLIKTRTEQEQVIVIAEAEAKKKIIAAQAEAEAILAKSEAQAKANELLAQSLNELVLEHQKLEKWDGKLPTVSGGNALVDIGTGD